MSTEKITMPQLGESVTEGTINSWLVKEGDHVNKYDPIADIMTDKVNAEVPSSYTGVIKELVATEGETVPVGVTICYIETDEEKLDEIKNDSALNQATAQLDENNQSHQSMKTRYSPAVLKLAQQHQVDLTTVTGSGRGGRITRKDVEKLINQSHDIGTIQVDNQKETSLENKMENIVGSYDAKEIPVTGVRKVIAEHMVKSKTEIPHAWMSIEVDVTDLVSYRDKIKDEFKQREGYSITYFSFFINAVAKALKQHPELNSTWAGDKIIQHKDIHISIAVAKDRELFVPVIKHADEKSIKGIAKDIYELATKARKGQLTYDEMSGGTFTVNNTGSFGSISSMGIINYPQAALLQVESIVKRPVIINNMFAARDIVNLSLSLDHRILDGLVCGQFMAQVKEILENMNEQTISIY